MNEPFISYDRLCAGLILFFIGIILVTLLNEWRHKRKRRNVRNVKGMYVPVPPKPDPRSSIELFARLNSKE